MNYLNFLVLICGVVGLLIVFTIRYKKSSARPFVCPMNFDCHAVVNSDYSRLLGLPLEIWGLVYYTLVTISYFLFLIFPELQAAWFSIAVMIISAIAFIFSAYLTYVQAVKLKQWCTYCLFSALMCTIIFSAVLIMKVLG